MKPRKWICAFNCFVIKLNRPIINNVDYNCGQLQYGLALSLLSANYLSPKSGCHTGNTGDNRDVLMGYKPGSVITVNLIAIK